MARIDGIDPDHAGARLRPYFDAQRAQWGDVLDPYLLYARRPGIFLAVRGMWDALSASGLIETTLCALVCRRVASLIGCPF